MGSCDFGRKDYRGLTDHAWRDAQEALVALVQRGVDRSDQDLARDGDYMRFLMAGMAIRRIGGRTAVLEARAVLAGLFPAQDLALDRLWAGLDG